MKIRIITTIALCTLLCLVHAQEEYKVNRSSGKLEITDINRVTLEGYDGSEIIIAYDRKNYSNQENEEDGANEFEHENENDGKQDRSKGLKMINSKGQTDNTGLGISVATEGGVTSITPMSANQKNRYLIKVPNGVNVYYEHNTYNGNRLKIRNTKSEVEVSVHYNSVEFENVQGPLSIKAVYGKIEGEVTDLNVNMSLHSTYGLVDIALPSDINADVILKTTYGQMYTDFDIKSSNPSSSNCAWCAKKMVGSINGGGKEISLSATYQSIYLRKS